MTLMIDSSMLYSEQIPTDMYKANKGYQPLILPLGCSLIETSSPRLGPFTFDLVIITTLKIFDSLFV